ncbi:DDB1 and CUL4-associated factor 8-like isoform X1 [Gossypium australe]|uniref:DDB1 and CUL4-associated factor 8-like isoform X1 n=1 Tax=Gossypium australe TaxID=47621 RepID=A0A5B6V6A3_9ROSI|nr:DDB1 and CUL4-associated factor 8-like isoform X1 [Gossypium australe]
MVLWRQRRIRSGRSLFAGAVECLLVFSGRHFIDFSPSEFERPQRANVLKDLVLRLLIYKKLEKHRGCVNTVSFNADGNILVSGSDDKRVILWDWETGNAKLTFQSGHVNNVFQAKIIPYSDDDRSLVTCAADGQVRQAQILERGVETKLLAKHQGRAHKLAIEPGSPYIFYTCGEDGLVQHIDLRTAASTELFTCCPVDDSRAYMPFIHLNAITIDPRNPNLFAVAGSDEYTRLYDIRKYKWDGSTDFGQPTDYFCPPHLIGGDQVGITGLAFSDQSELLVSYNDEFIYLFTRDMGLGPNPIPSSPLSACSEASDISLDHSATDANEKAIPQVYKGHRNCKTVKGVNFFGPKADYVVSGSDCGRIFIWKKKGGELIRVMEADKYVVNCIESHPHTTVLASSGIESDIKIWTPKAIDKPTLPANVEQFKPKPGGWMYGLMTPQDMLLHLLEMQGSPEFNESIAGRELLEFLLAFNANSDASSDVAFNANSDASSDGGNASGPEDLFS